MKMDLLRFSVITTVVDLIFYFRNIIKYRRRLKLLAPLLQSSMTSIALFVFVLVTTDVNYLFQVFPYTVYFIEQSSLRFYFYL